MQVEKRYFRQLLFEITSIIKVEYDIKRLCGWPLKQGHAKSVIVTAGTNLVLVYSLQDLLGNRFNLTAITATEIQLLLFETVWFFREIINRRLIHWELTNLTQ